MVEIYLFINSFKVEQKREAPFLLPCLWMWPLKITTTQWLDKRREACRGDSIVFPVHPHKNHAPLTLLGPVLGCDDADFA